MVDLYDLIRNIEKRPAMYLGQVSISNLRAFLAGYCFARRQMGLPQTQQEQQFSEFPAWIQDKFNLPSHQTWARIILFFSQNENTALDRFFQLFDEFTKTDYPNKTPTVTNSASE